VTVRCASAQRVESANTYTHCASKCLWKTGWSTFFPSPSGLEVLALASPSLSPSSSNPSSSAHNVAQPRRPYTPDHASVTLLSLLGRGKMYHHPWTRLCRPWTPFPPSSSSRDRCEDSTSAHECVLAWRFASPRAAQSISRLSDHTCQVTVPCKFKAEPMPERATRRTLRRQRAGAH
jgi:hypothetical protein